MSISKLPNGRYRCQVYDASTRRNVSAAKVLGLPKDQATFATKREAKAAREDARRKLAERRSGEMTVRDWATIWTTDPLYQRPKESTNILNRERIARFVTEHANLQLQQVDHQIVARWIAGGRNLGTVPSLSAMFNDAASLKAGQLITFNPFAKLGISKGKGNAQVPPPSEAVVRTMIAQARDIASPAFAAWLQVACFTGMRPGELDGLHWDAIDLEHDRIVVREQFNAKTRTPTLPKNGKVRTILLTPPAREALIVTPRESEHCFVSLRGRHFTPSSRAYHWKAVRAAAGLTGKSLYVCTRHFCGWYLVNVLEMSSEDVAIQLGHEDGGELVRRLYGHRDKELALRRLDAAFARVGEVRPLKIVERTA